MMPRGAARPAISIVIDNSDREPSAREWSIAKEGSSRMDAVAR